MFNELCQKLRRLKNIFERKRKPPKETEKKCETTDNTALNKQINKFKSAKTIYPM